MNKAYEFISYPYENLFGISPKVTTALTIHDQDISLDEMLLQFTNFLRSAGYTIDSDQYLSIISDEELEDEYQEEDYEELWDEEDKAVENWSPSDVTRVEVIDAEGRAYVNTNAAYVVTDLQDEGRTLKVFIK